MLDIHKNIDRGMLLDALCVAAPVGLFYDSVGRILIWSLFAISLFSYRSLSISSRLLSNSIIYLALLVFISLLSLNPGLSLDAVSRIFLGFLIFLPGVYVGTRWRTIPPRGTSFLPVLILVAVYLASPHYWGSHLYFGFDENPNIVGRSLTVSILALFIAGSSLLGVHAINTKSAGEALRWILYLVPLSALLILLIFSNFRSGWLGLCVGAVFYLCTSRSFGLKIKSFSALILASTLSFLIFAKDYKGFGYGSIGERFDLWSRALSSWHESFFLFGSGFASFPKMSHLYYYGSVSRVFNYPHNIIVEIIFSVGVVGLVATGIYLASQVGIFSSSNLVWTSELSRAAIASILAMFVIGQFDMEFASFDYIASLSFFAGVLYAQRAGFLGLEASSSRCTDRD